MLTKSLVRFKIRKGNIQPNFLDPSDEDLLEGARLLISTFEESVGRSREELSRESSELIDALPTEALIGRGFEKLLLDRTEFLVPDDVERPAYRAKVFTQTSAALTNTTFSDYKSYCDWAEATFEQPLDQIGVQLFSDLPGQNPVTRFKGATPLGIIHHYNRSTVQWLLLHSGALVVTLADARPGSLRQLFKYLRFNQLLAKIKEQEQGVRLEIEGPLAMFYQTRKYGMNLANFFPALLHQERWHLEAEIKINENRKGRLTLDQSKGLKPAKERFLAYVPDEISLFRNAVKKKIEGWQVAPTARFVPLAGEERCFPDFSLTHDTGATIAIELFHAWHGTQLVSRLRLLDQSTKVPLLLGVASRLTRDPLTADLLKDSPYFSKWGFLYRDIPTVNKVKPLLEQLLKVEEPQEPA